MIDNVYKTLGTSTTYSTLSPNENDDFLLVLWVV